MLALESSEEIEVVLREEADVKTNQTQFLSPYIPIVLQLLCDAAEVASFCPSEGGDEGDAEDFVAHSSQAWSVPHTSQRAAGRGCSSAAAADRLPDAAGSEESPTASRQ